MKRSTDRILTTHAGALSRPPELRALLSRRDSGEAVAEADLTAHARASIADAVRMQISSGIDVVNDGELAKPNFLSYITERLTGHEVRPIDQKARSATIAGRDMQEFPEYWAGRGLFGAPANPATEIVCSGPLAYTGQAAIAADIENFRVALQGTEPVETFLPAIAPGTIEHFMRNVHYPSDEAFFSRWRTRCTIEYRAIVDAGFILQIDDPDLPDAWQMHPEMDVPAYRASRRFASKRSTTRSEICPSIRSASIPAGVAIKGRTSTTSRCRRSWTSCLLCGPKRTRSKLESGHEHEWTVWQERSCRMARS